MWFSNRMLFSICSTQQRRRTTYQPWPLLFKSGIVLFSYSRIPVLEWWDPLEMQITSPCSSYLWSSWWTFSCGPAYGEISGWVFLNIITDIQRLPGLNRLMKVPKRISMNHIQPSMSGFTMMSGHIWSRFS